METLEMLKSEQTPEGTLNFLIYGQRLGEQTESLTNQEQFQNVWVTMLWAEICFFFYNTRLRSCAWSVRASCTDDNSSALQRSANTHLILCTRRDSPMGVLAQRSAASEWLADCKYEEPSHVDSSSLAAHGCGKKHSWPTAHFLCLKLVLKFLWLRKNGKREKVALEI